MTQLDTASALGAGEHRTEPMRAVSAGIKTRETRAYRPELQGLRALAVLLVVVYHVWLNRVSGGVDVFFVITGFLIVGQLFRASERGGIRYGPMWGRMIKRLFPAALTVLVGVMAACFLWLPEHRWFQTIQEVFAAALYWENWQLVADSTDYFAQNNVASVVQHFWSLSIQGQFYVVMPLVVGLVGLVVHRLGWGLRGPLLAVVIGLFATSLAYSVWLTNTDQALAYFHSLTRVWEFMLGGLLALVIDSVRLPRWLRIVLGWAGVIGLVTCGLLLQVGSMFPGYVALWPTMAAVFVLLAGATNSRAGADRWLCSKPLEFVGNISYSLYLWHWPVLVLYLSVRGQESVGLKGGALIISTSFALAVATYYLVEEPARRSKFGIKRAWGGYAFGAVLLVPVLLLTQGWQVYAEQQAAAVEVGVNDPNYPGAIALTAGYTQWEPFEDEPAPNLFQIPHEWSRLPDRTCYPSRHGHEVNVCKSKNGATPKKRIAIVGDSHPQMYVGAINPLIEKNDWEVFTIRRPGCPFSVNSELIKGSQGCVDWNAALIEELKDLKPDAVVTMSTYQVRKGLTERTPPGFVEQWRKLERAGIPVVAFRDNPRYGFEPTNCANEKGPDAPECAGLRSEFYQEVSPYERIPNMPSNVAFIDTSDLFCDQRGKCPPIIGNVRVYMDDNHITGTYMKTMAPIVEERMTHALGW